MSGGDLHHLRSAIFRHEHEPGADVWLGGGGIDLGGALDLLTAHVLAMQLAAQIYVRSNRVVYCAKLHHHNGARCIFNRGFSQLLDRESK